MQLVRKVWEKVEKNSALPTEAEPKPTHGE